MERDVEPVATAALIQARNGSTRLAGKIHLRIGEATLLAWVVARARAAAGIDRVVVATSDRPDDDATADEAARLGVDVFRGSADDVLGRFVGALTRYPATTVCRLTGDNPLLDPETLTLQIAAHVATGADWTGCEGGRRSVGEVVDAQALLRAAAETADPHCREHVTPYLYTHPDRFRLHRIVPPAYLAGGTARLTVDTGADLSLVRTLHDRLAAAGRPFAVREALALMEADPTLAAINADVRQRGWRE